MPPLGRAAEGADVLDAVASSRSAVCFSPSKPWLTAWLEAVVQASQPMLAIHGAISGGAAKTGKLWSGWPGPANGTSSWQIAGRPLTSGRSSATSG